MVFSRANPISFNYITNTSTYHRQRQLPSPGEPTLAAAAENFAEELLPVPLVLLTIRSGRKAQDFAVALNAQRLKLRTVCRHIYRQERFATIRGIDLPWRGNLFVCPIG